MSLVAHASVSIPGPGAERQKGQSQKKLAAFDANLSLEDRRRLKQWTLKDRDHLMPRQKNLYDERRKLKEEAVYWENVVALKSDLLKMPGGGDSREAESIAQTAIRGFADLRKKYEMLRPPVLHNFLVNTGVKNEGLCWQWTRDMTRKLMGLHLKSYDLLWATAREATVREHNTVVVVSSGHPLEDGLFWMVGLTPESLSGCVFRRILSIPGN